MISRKILLLVFLISSIVYGQEIPPIQIFTTQDYKAEDQNWDISQDKEGVVYFANNKGLLRYNGARWELFPTPNQSILRSVNIINEKIYTGSYMDFGYWEKDNYGGLVYTSLIDKHGIDPKEDEQFWDIVEIENYILFQSLDRIYIYSVDANTFKIIESNQRINKIFKVNQTIYFQKNGNGIYEILNGEERLVLSSKKFQDNEIISIYSIDESLLLVTRENGIYSYKNGEVSIWNNKVNDVIKNLSVYSSIRLSDGSFIFGTISEGILHLNSNGEKIIKINQAGGLSNNTVLSVFEGNQGDLWLGLDNGINCVNLNSPYRVYKDKQGVLGTIYTSIKVDENLYLGTNQGLFYKDLTKDTKFSFIEKTKGQVWGLEYLKGTLFCGHDKGTFIINNDKAELLNGEIGSWVFNEIEDKPNFIIQGGYEGLSILELRDGIWSFRNRIEGFDISSRYFEFVNSNELLVNHEYKGVYKVKIDSNFTKVLDFKKLDIKEGPKSSITKYQGEILYCNKDGVFYYNKEKSEFIKNEVLSEPMKGDGYLSGKLVYDKSGNRLWLFSKNNIFYVEPGTLSEKPKINYVPISYELRNSKVGYENILRLNKNEYLVGANDGYLVVNLDKLDKVNNQVNIDNISFSSLHNKSVNLGVDESAELENKNNSILFKYSVTDFNKFSNTKYKYRLVGIYDNWSDWTPKSEVHFENLPHGNYTFEVKAHVGGIESNNTASYNFTIERPWYLKPMAIATYIIFGLLFLFLIQYFNSRYYKKQKQKLLEKKQRELELEQLENQRQLIQFKNQNLQLDIENKNRELGTATMNLVKRNELLNSIKEELSKSKSLNDIKGVVRLINSNLNNTSDWKLFEEAFNNVDKDFMKRIKALHPSITSNDLRLCAYLRLNLSSKEIAPLLNISHKSVEVKRYRLRKKMGLDHDESLTDYILDL
ncbi:MAG: LuxR family transcriptional regulator [Winogradskyella sp.]|nr:LuxR family transcriptional regulator [Winogradskyella sp.]